MASNIPDGPRTVFFSGDVSRPVLAEGRRVGRFVRIAKGVWSADTVTPVEQIVHQNLWRIIASYCPDAVVVDRTAARTGSIDRGVVTIATDVRSTPIEMPGVRLLVRPRVTHPTDTPWSHELTGSAAARTLVDNLAESRGRGDRPGRTLTLPELEDWVAEKRLAWGHRRFEALREEAVGIAAELGQDPEAVENLVDTVAGAATDAPASGAFARAALAGRAWDARRVAMFERTATMLADLTDPQLIAVEPEGELPFYEAYFSNFIEGTEFTVQEARQIVATQVPPARRSADGHDILGTHRCVVDPIGRRQTGGDPDERIDLLRERHRTLMVGRPDIGPGRFKSDANRAGATEFVDPELVHGTLLRGLDQASDVPAGLARAVYVMVVITQIHPFTDGNGRAARLSMNAELSAGGRCRVVIPTIMRSEYVSSLRRFFNDRGDVTAVVRVLTHALRWTAAMPWHDRAAVDAQMQATNATVDPMEAEDRGVHLQLP